MFVLFDNTTLFKAKMYGLNVEVYTHHAAVFVKVVFHSTNELECINAFYARIQKIVSEIRLPTIKIYPVPNWQICTESMEERTAITAKIGRELF
ncbi:MAG: hypothetical protein AAB875_05135 [Patescibacteria group bacterium]